ncbi:type VI secretion system tip protein VgrG, partial [Pseudomonas sp. Dout3]|nr:type VI secretion system tip protein VgrG [Pseudomonas sp. Dout3]MEB0099640.1 type VI secretion system tip protein VgrG [Pseudomonas sp. DC1.2]
STTVAGTLVIQAGSQAHMTAANVVVDSGMSLTLKAGGHHLVISAGGIFSSVAIVEGGAPVAGIPALLARSLVPVAPQALIAHSLAAQKLALTQAAQQASPVCTVCQKLAEMTA